MDLMKKVIVCALFFLGFVINSHTAYALPSAGTGDLVPEILKRDCGYGDSPYTNQCCPEVDFEKKVIAPMSFVLGAVPLVPETVIASLVRNAYEILPMRSTLHRSCRIGEETWKNPADKSDIASCTCVIKPTPAPPTPTGEQISKLCTKYVYNKKELAACNACAKTGALMTGIGCVPTDFSEFITGFLLRIGIGFAGFVALGCIIYSAVMIQVSQGNAEKISQAQDQIKACIFGLLMIVFSILLLRIIGVDIIQIPGFS